LEQRIYEDPLDENDPFAEEEWKWADIGKFDNRRNWIATPAYPLSGFGVRTPKKKKAKNG